MGIIGVILGVYKDNGKEHEVEKNVEISILLGMI